MTRLLIAYPFSEALRQDRGWAAWWVQRLLWFAEDGDVLVLPEPPDESFLAYVTELTGVRADTLRIVVPPAGAVKAAQLTVDRMADPALHAELRSVLAGEPVRTVFALWPDPSVAALARTLGCADALPGCDFIAQGGGVLVNSKTVFRAVAAGSGIPVPVGSVCSSAAAVEEQVVEMFADGRYVMLKQDFLSGGHGNEVLSPNDQMRPVGARRVVVLRDRAAIREYLAKTWDWLSGGGHHRVVVEEYHRDSAAYCGDYFIDDDSVRLTGSSELFYAPYAVAQILPAPTFDADTLDALLDHGRRLGEALQRMGYRGFLAADAIVTPDKRILFTEWNGRVSGTTHLYRALGERVVGGYAADRVLLDRSWPAGWTVESFAGAVERLTATGYAYDRGSRLGVLLSSAFNSSYRTVMHTIVAKNTDDAWQMDAALASVFGPREAA